MKKARFWQRNTRRGKFLSISNNQNVAHLCTMGYTVLLHRYSIVCSKMLNQYKNPFSSQKPTTYYRVFMMESTKSKQLLWDFLLKDHMVSWVNLIGIKRPFCETKSNFWYSEIFFSVHFGDISKLEPFFGHFPWS